MRTASVVARAPLGREAGSGGGEAVERWIRSEAGPLLRIARRYLRDEVASQDVVRDVLLRALRALSDGDAGPASPSALRRKSLERALQRLRSRTRSEAEIEDLLPRFCGDGSHARETKPWRSPPDALRGAGGLAEALLGCVDRLPEPHRTVLMLSDAERLDIPSIARHLATSEALVKKDLHQARLALRTLLDPHMRVGEPGRRERQRTRATAPIHRQKE